MSLIGGTIGSYRITKLLGEGGMGAVYQATDNIEREVALKVMAPQLTRDPSRAQRFRAEAMALGRLHHANITSLFQLLEADDATYLVMELVEGHTLDELIRRSGALPPRLALELLIEALHGLEHAHARGVIHRDIKASNLMVSSDGTLKIMDFGIARIDGTTRLTQTSQPVGTLAYMSPEQVRGLEPDARSDLYSLATLGFELLTGRVPFNDATDFELMRSHLEKAPPSVRHLVPSLPVELDAILTKALAKNPQDRFQNGAELRGALEEIAAKLPADSGVASLVSNSNAAPQKTTTTPIPATKRRYDTLADNSVADDAPAPEDRYATRLVGTPLPSISHANVAPPASISTPNSPPLPPKSAPLGPTGSSRIPTLAVGGIALLVLAILAATKFWPGAREPGIPAQKPTAPAAIALKSARPNSPQRTGVDEKSAPRRSPRRARRLRAAKRIQPRRNARGAVVRVRAKSAPRKVRPQVVVRRSSRPRSAPRRDEGAILRAIIKGR